MYIKTSLVALLGTSAYAAEPLTITVTDVADVIGGILVGALQEQFAPLGTCITDTYTIGSDVVIAVEDFEKETFDDTESGIKLLGAAVTLIPDAMTNCKDIVADFQKLVDMAEQFADPATFAWDVAESLVVNGVDIYHKVSSAVDYYHSSDYYNFGVEIGEALSEVLLGAEE